jgi:hypothetical protein
MKREERESLEAVSLSLNLILQETFDLQKPGSAHVHGLNP